MLTLKDLFDRFSELVIAGGVSTFGGIAAYIYKMTKTNEKFSFKFFFAAAFLSFFLGNMIGSFVPVGKHYRDGLLMMSGFLSYPILALLESNGMKWMIDLLPIPEKLKGRLIEKIESSKPNEEVK